MKKYLFILLYAFVAQTAMWASDTYPTVMRKDWVLRYQDENEGNLFRKYKIETSTADTMIAGRGYTYAVTFTQEFNRHYSMLTQTFGTEYDTLYYRQEGDKVYAYDREGQTELLLLDYGLKEGEAFTSPWGERFTVVETGCLQEYAEAVCTYENEKPRMLRLRSDDGGSEDVWIDGMGSVKWGIFPQGGHDNCRVQTVATGGRNDHVYDALFDVDTEHYKFIHFMPQGQRRNGYEINWGLEFHGDTLCIKGVVPVHDVNGPNYLEMIVTDDNVIALTDILSLHHHGILSDVGFDLDIRIPGFKPGKYTYGYDTLVCSGTDGIGKIGNGENETMRGKSDAVFDLSGRRIDHSQFSTPNSQFNKGVYIRQGRKVVK